MPNGYALPGGVGGPYDLQALDYFDTQPDAAFQDWATALGAGGDDPFSRWLRSRQSSYTSDYQASLARNPIGRAANGDPNLYFRNFLNSINPRGEYQSLSSRQKGINTSNYAPQMRWLTSVI